MSGTAALRLVIVDDEPLAIDRLERLIGRIDGFEVVGRATDGAAGLAVSREMIPDLCLLDIAMPGISGIELARALAMLERPPKIVFVTAFEHFAVAAFDANAVDYLIKPVDPERLVRALERTRRRIAEPGQPQDVHLAEFWVPDPQGLRRISARDVDKITAERDYVRIHTGPRSWLLNDSLVRLEQDLDPRLFLRVHRSAIVRRSFIAGLRHDERGWIAWLSDGSEQRVGRVYAGRVRALRAGSDPFVH